MHFIFRFNDVALGQLRIKKKKSPPMKDIIYVYPCYVIVPLICNSNQRVQ